MDLLVLTVRPDRLDNQGHPDSLGHRVKRVCKVPRGHLVLLVPLDSLVYKGSKVPLDLLAAQATTVNRGPKDNREQQGPPEIMVPRGRQGLRVRLGTVDLQGS